jgi:hypothetical protein
VTDPAEPAATEPVHRRRLRWLAAGAAVVILVVGFLGITGATGLGGPRWMQRYQYSELSDLAALVNDGAGALRTADDCWRTTPSKGDSKRNPDGPLRDIAKVDYLRSRVVVRGYANQSGIIDATTHRAINQKLDELFAAHPELSWNMVILEPSPDGWSPLVSCKLVTRGWIVGF